MTFLKHHNLFKAIRCLILFCSIVYLPFLTLAKPTIPPFIENSFKQLFPTAAASKWKIKANGEYSVSFNLNKVAHVALLDSKGNLIEKQKLLTKKELPKEVTLYLEKQYEGYKLLKAIEVSNLTADTLRYAVQLKDGKDKVDLYLSKDGYLLAK